MNLSHQKSNAISKLLSHISLKHYICNYDLHSKNIDFISDQECYCKLDKYSKYVDKYHSHIITGDLCIIEDPILRYYMSSGTKFRLDTFPEIRVL